MTVIDLLVPALIGVFMFAFQRRGNGGPTSTTKLSIYDESDSEWNDFWRRRRKKPLGRLISLIRRNLITPALVDYVEKNTRRGTLIEAGCGTAEVSIGVAEKRGDKVILVDTSEEALEVARIECFSGRDITDVMNCDINDLIENAGYLLTGLLSDIGIIRAFPKTVQPFFIRWLL